MPSTTVRRPTTSRLIRGLALPMIPFLVVVLAVSTIELVGVSGSVRFVLQMTLGIPVYLYSAIRRLFIERVAWDDTGVTIHNAWMSYSFDWSEVASIEMGKPWWLQLDQGKSDLYVPVVQPHSGQERPISVMYSDGSDPNIPSTSRKARTAWVDKTLTQMLITEANTRRT